MADCFQAENRNLDPQLNEEPNDTNKFQDQDPQGTESYRMSLSNLDTVDSNATTHGLLLLERGVKSVHPFLREKRCRPYALLESGFSNRPADGNRISVYTDSKTPWIRESLGIGTWF